MYTILTRKIERGGGGERERGEEREGEREGERVDSQGLCLF